MKAKHYAIVMYGDVEPNTYGPYKTTEERDKKALSHRELHGDEDGIYWARVTEKGELEIGAYSGAFFNEMPTNGLAVQ